VWGDCDVFIELVVGGDVKPLWHQRLRGSTPEFTFNIALSPQSVPAQLRVRVDEGEGGPVQDRAILRRPLLLLNQAGR